MRIAEIAPVGTHVSETALGSIERMVWLLARELTELGHDVTVFAADGSDVPGELIPTLPGTYALNGSPPHWQTCEWINVARAIERSDSFDVMHSHSYLWGVPLTALARCPLVHTTHLIPHDDEARIRELYPEAVVTAISEGQWRGFPHLPPAAVIPHGADPTGHSLGSGQGGYLCYLGRFTPGKAPLEAISVARELGMPLVMAGPADSHYHDLVASHVDGKSVQYVGFVDPRERDQLLGGASALLYPLQAPEPFGLVMVESMLCGTPVAALAVGAVTEIVDEGVTGAAELEPARLADAVERCMALDRARVRERALERFTARRMALGYLEVYERVREGAPCPS